MLPEASNLGIGRVISAYHAYLPKFGVQFVSEQEADLVVCHAGNHAKNRQTDVLICHGLYPTYNLDKSNIYFETNAQVITNAREALAITVPSHWVAMPFKRDMALNPFILPHAINADEWSYPNENQGYVLWAKGHTPGVCNPAVVNELAKKLPNVQFVTTFGDQTLNVKVIGAQTFEKMKQIIAHAGAYLATTKETFGIQTLEAMACGVPVIGYKHGATPDIVRHGETGWLSEVDDIDNLATGVQWALGNHNAVGMRARVTAEQYSWESVCDRLYSILNWAQSQKIDNPLVSVIIPCYNYGKWVGSAIESVINQTYKGRVEVLVVDDGSTDNTPQAVKPYIDKVTYLRKENGGVAEARNYGIRHAKGELISCLDADDAWKPDFLEKLVPPMLKDRSLGLVYGHLEAVTEHRSTHVSAWPPAFDFKEQVRRHNCVPSSCLFRKSAWVRAGGYKAKYTPAEDADLWLKIAATGHNVRKITDDPVYMYRLHSSSLSRTHNEPNWVFDKPYHHDPALTPFATPANGVASYPFKDYDDPWISVIIPVGPGHENLVYRALDSLQMQTLVNWEVVVINDSGKTLIHQPTGVLLSQAYPYIIEGSTGRSGVATARNLGVKLSHSDLLLFLDADDWLLPNCLADMVRAYNDNPCNYVYSDWMGFDGKTTSNHVSKDFSVSGILKEALHPITALVPKAWHQEINGFDVSLSGWEDWVYYLDLVKAGHCGVRVPVPCMVYDYSSGTRREDSLKMRNELLPVVRRRFKEADMGCSSCGHKGGGGSSRNAPIPVPSRSSSMRGAPAMASKNMSNTHDTGVITTSQDKMVLVLENSGNVGAHGIVGVRTRINYGRHKHGDTFKMHIDDVLAQPHRYVRIPEKQVQTTMPTKPEAPASAISVEPQSMPVLESIPHASQQQAQEILVKASEPVPDDEVEIDITIMPLIAIKKLDLSKEDAAMALESERSASKPRASVVKYLEQVISGVAGD